MGMFNLFPQLPTELRLAIWALAPREQRVVGLHSTTEKPELRCIVQLKEHAIFGPLHACYESRAVWFLATSDRIPHREPTTNMARRFYTATSFSIGSTPTGLDLAFPLQRREPVEDTPGRGASHPLEHGSGTS
jgi:hypothetical protein